MRRNHFRFSLTLIAALLATMTMGPVQAQHDMLLFMDSTLPAAEYVAVHAEGRDTAQDPWSALTGVYQPFKSRVNWRWGQVYWRKDSLDEDFYGELFTFDTNTIFLHVETELHPLDATHTFMSGQQA